MADRSKLDPATLRYVVRRMRKWSVSMLAPKNSKQAVGALAAEKYWADTFASEARALTRKPRKLTHRPRKARRRGGAR